MAWKSLSNIDQTPCGEPDLWEQSLWELDLWVQSLGAMKATHFKGWTV
jgi:hypothetical protein